MVDEEGDNDWAEDEAVVLAERQALAELKAEAEEVMDRIVAEASDEEGQKEETIDEDGYNDDRENNKLARKIREKNEKEEKLIRKIQEKKASGKKGKIAWLMR